LENKNNDIFPETNSAEEIVSDTNIALDDKSINQKLKSVNLPSNKNLTSENEANIPLTYPENREK
jgi:hypothetical protein